jgi:hypothetical protein
MENAGPVIRYRIAREMLPERDAPRSFIRERLRSELVRHWLGSLGSDCGRSGLHGARPETYENVMGKLYEFGFRKGMPELDRRTVSFRKWMGDQYDRPISGYLPVFHRTLVASFLAMTGYGEEVPVRSWTERRLDSLYEFAKRGDLSEVYVPTDRYPGFPKAFKGAPLVNPDLYPDEEMKLPWIHDLNAFLHTGSIMDDPTLRSKVEAIVDLILSPKYQDLRPGYGVVRHGSRYYMMGWSVHLPGYRQGPVPGTEFGRMLLLLAQLSRSRRAREHPWFERCLSTLAEYEDEKGLVAFPRECLQEKRSGVWVLGMRMGLEEDRRRSKSIVCESTFRSLEIHHRVLSER